jgi:hypothetical protein
LGYWLDFLHFQVSLVINYDLPNNRELYIHRIGRSGRFGRKVKFLISATNYDSCLFLACQLSLSPVDRFVVAYLLNLAKSTSTQLWVCDYSSNKMFFMSFVVSRESCLCNVEFSCPLHFFGRQDKKRGIEIVCSLHPRCHNSRFVAWKNWIHSCSCVLAMKSLIVSHPDLLYEV